jgi:hypothetical protein
MNYVRVIQCQPPFCTPSLGLNITSMTGNRNLNVTHVNSNMDHSTAPQTRVNIQGKDTIALWDSGAEVNCISDTFAETLGIECQSTSNTLRGINDLPLRCKGTCQLQIQLADRQWTDTFYVLTAPPQDVLIGTPTMRAQRIDISNTGDCLYIHGEMGHRQSVPMIKPKPLLPTQGVLQLCEKTQIPPMSEMLVACIAQGSKKDPFYGSQTVLVRDLDHQSLGIPLHVGRGAATMQDGKTTLAIANMTHHTLDLPVGCLIGKYHSVNPEDLDIITLGDLENPTQGHNSRRVNLVLKDLAEKRSISKEDIAGLPENVHIGKESLAKDQMDQLLDVIRRFAHLFATDPNNPGQISRTLAEHTIDTGNAKPVAQPPRRVSPHNREVIREAIKKMLDAGIISPSRSPWASPVVLVPKKTGEVRFAIDYRKLNDVTKKEIYALPRIDDTLDALGNAKWFSTFDMASGYWQIPMAKEDIEKTAFITFEGQFQYNVMPFGLCNAPATYQRCMDAVLAGIKWQCCLVYLDDVICVSPTFEQHMKDLVAVLTRLEGAGLKLKASKCHFCCTEVEYLGHLITQEGVRADPAKLKVISAWPIPQTVQEVQSFLGLTGYYRKLIRNYAMFEAPLRKVTRDDQVFHMGPDQIKAFETLKQALVSDPVIALPDFSGKSKIEIHTDASDLGIGAVLTQIDEQGKERVIRYASRMLSKNELKWHTQEKEALAIIWACAQFRPYILGSKVKVRTDHRSLKWLKTAEKGRLARWAMALEDYDLEIEHRAGKANANADVLSRTAKTPPDETWDAEDAPRQDPLGIYAVLPELSTSPDTLSKWVRQIEIAIQRQDHDDLRMTLEVAQSRSEEMRKVMAHLEANDLEGAVKALPLAYIAGAATQQIQLVIKNELLCRVVTGKTGLQVIQILVPDSGQVRSRLIRLHHEPELAGHLGPARTFERLRQKYYWPTMRRDVDAYIKGCMKCQKHKGTAPNITSKTLKPSLPSEPNARLGVDLIGPLPLTEHTQSQYILVMIDYFTKWPEAAPLKTKSQAEVADAIYNIWYSRHGIPYEIQTDQGTEFTNDLLKRLNARLGVGQRVTTPYYPAANGEVERFNRTLKTCLSIYAAQRPATWDRYLSALLFAYRTSHNPQTGFTPYYLMHGREARLPTDVLDGPFEDIANDFEQYGLHLTDHLRKANKVVKDNLVVVAQKTKRRWDEGMPRKKAPKFSIGDKVLMFQPQLNTNAGDADHTHVFQPKWKGPYTVMEHPHEDVYVIRDEDTQREWSVNVHKLRPYEPNAFLETLDDLTQEDAPMPDLRRQSISAGHGDPPLNASKIPAPNESRDVPVGSDASEAVQPSRMDPRSKIASNTRYHRHKTGMTRQEHVRAKQRTNNASQPQRSEADLEPYEIEKVIGHRRDKNRLLYKVRWKGYSEEDDTEIPASSFDTQDCLKEYWQSLPTHERPRKYRKLDQGSTPAKDIRIDEQ